MTSSRTPMSDDHKAALAEGRTQSRVVRDYLEALQTSRPKRGRKRTKESIEKRLTRINEDYDQADALKQLRMAQERLNLESELASMENTFDISALEADFVQVAKPYAERKGITYAAFRELGVTPSILKRAGISR